jgi:DNA-binding NarL/FixJ family response regulator
MAAEKNRVSILIASPNVLPSQLMAAALNRQPQFHVVAIVSTTREILDVVKTAPLDVALIRATLADDLMGGLAALRHLRECAPELKTILLLDSQDMNLVVDAFRAGAKGIFYPSRSTFKALCKCVDRVHRGQIWATSGELVLAMEAFAELVPKRVVDASGMRLLTKREEDVVHLLGEGLQNREIARKLSLSEHTVKNYLFHVFDKLGVSSRVELILYANSSTRRMQIGTTSFKQEDATVYAPEQK